MVINKKEENMDSSRKKESLSFQTNLALPLLQLKRSTILAVAFALFTSGLAVGQQNHTLSDTKPAVLMSRLGRHHHPVSTTNPEAQRGAFQWLLQGEPPQRSGCCRLLRFSGFPERARGACVEYYGGEI
jgi:hypothetical protein